MDPDAQAKEVERMLTPELREIADYIKGRLPEGWGFGCLIFEFGPPGSPLLWISNAKRPDMLEAMREFIERNGGEAPR